MRTLRDLERLTLEFTLTNYYRLQVERHLSVAENMMLDDGELYLRFIQHFIRYYRHGASPLACARDWIERFN